jgi:phosphoglycolate phosphatase
MVTAKTKIRKVLLFDLDWTLIYTGGAGVRALNTSYQSLFGISEAAKSVVLDGKTDRAICREMIVFHQKRPAQESEIQALSSKYLEQLAIEVPRSEGYRVLPGISEILERLKDHPEVILTLGTGNFKKGAEIKLARADFWKYFPVGGFADDSEKRPEILGAAVRRSEEYAGRSFSGSEILVIGDTVHDISAGRAIGASVLAVACGPTKSEILAAQKPDYLFNDLSDTAKTLEVLLS